MTATPSLPPATAAGEAPPLTTPSRRLDPLASWRRHRRKLPVVALLALALGAPLAWWAGRPTFYAEAALRVSPSYVENLQDESDVQLASTTQYQQFVQQQIAMLRSYEVASAALAHLGARRGLWQRPDESERRAAERLMAALLVRPVRDTYLVTVGLDGEAPEGLADIVNAVAEVYADQARDEGLFGSDERVRQLAERRRLLEADIERDVARLSAIAGELGVSTFNDTERNPLDASLEATDAALADWRRRRIAAEARLAALEAAQAREGALEVDSEARQQLNDNQALASATRLYHERRQALLAQGSGLAADHPGARAIARQLEELDADFARVAGQQLVATKEVLAQRRATHAAEEHSRAALDVAHARDVEAQLATELAAQQARIAQYAVQYQTAVDLTGDIRRTRKRIESISNRMDSFSLEAGAPGFVRLATPAREVEQPITGGRRKLLLLVLAGAGLLTLLVPLLLDRFDRRILLPGDLERLLGFAPLAWIVRRGPAGQSAVATDQTRRLGLALARERQRDGTRRVALCGVRDGAASGALAANLAGELRRHGMRAAIARGTLNGAAPTPEESADIVLIDAPPLLASADAEDVVARADLALLVVAAGELESREVVAAARVLERVAPAAVGAVLTEVAADEHPRSVAGMLPRPLPPPSPPWRLALQRWLWT